MGWGLGLNGERDVGYGVPAWCDHPDCNEEIDRGLNYVCGGEHGGGERGCGLYFCEEHRSLGPEDDDPDLCERCIPLDDDGNVIGPDFEPSPDHPEWIDWKLTDESWAEWRAKNPEWVAAMQTTKSAAEAVSSDDQPS